MFDIFFLCFQNEFFYLSKSSLNKIMKFWLFRDNIHGQLIAFKAVYCHLLSWFFYWNIFYVLRLTRSVPAKSVVTVSHKITEKNTWPQPSRHKFQSDNHYKQQPPSYLSIWCIFSGKYERKTMNLIDSLMFSILAT